MARLQYRINHSVLCDPATDATLGAVRYVDHGSVCEVVRNPCAEAELRQAPGHFTATTPHHVQEAAEPGCWLSLPDPEAWLAFMLQQLPRLEHSGWEVEFSEVFPYRLARAGAWYSELAIPEETAGDWFSLELGVLVDGERVNLLPLEDGRYLPVARSRIDNIVATLVELYEADSLIDDKRLSLPSNQVSRITQLAQHYSLLILDEAQAVKNPHTRAARTVRCVRSEHRLCLTGTPMENHLGELWSLFDFLLPGYLGDERQFKRLYRTPIEREGNTLRGQALSKRIAPFFLRRSKAEVAPELPLKTEILRKIPLGEEQQDLAVLFESLSVTG